MPTRRHRLSNMRWSGLLPFALAAVVLVCASAQNNNACDQPSLTKMVDGLAGNLIDCDNGVECNIVTCNSAGNVVNIVVDQVSGVSGGSLPSSIQSLSSLEVLVLKDVALEGTLPPSLGSLANLSTLVLSLIHI